MHSIQSSSGDTTAQTLTSPAKNTTSELPESSIVVPPGCDTAMLRGCGEPVCTYVPPSYRPYTPKDSDTGMIPHSMSGKTGVISIPKNPLPSAAKSMTEYLSQFQNAHLCLDLWFGAKTRIKKCGVLTEIGKDFIALRDSCTGSLTVIDLKPIRYINIYCK